MLFISEDFVHQCLPLCGCIYCRESYRAPGPQPDLSFLSGLVLTAVSAGRGKNVTWPNASQVPKGNDSISTLHLIHIKCPHLVSEVFQITELAIQFITDFIYPESIESQLVSSHKMWGFFKPGSVVLQSSLFWHARITLFFLPLILGKQIYNKWIYNWTLLS